MLPFLQIQKIDSLLRDTTTLSVENISDKINSLSTMSSSELFTTLIGDFIKFGLKVLAALIVYAIGAWVIRRIKRGMMKLFERKGTEASLAGFLSSFVHITLVIILIVIVVGTLGINTSSFAAILASGGLAIGMAMSGTLQNFAGGIMILAFKPFKVGDYIEAQGYTGNVQSISITSTKLTTDDNKLVVIPNGALSNGSLNNYSATGVRRVEWKISISYGDDVSQARSLILELFSKDQRILNEPASPAVVLGQLADSSIIIYIRAWTDVSEYWSVYYYYNEVLYNELPKHGFSFPFPQVTISGTIAENR
ncbi:MAG: mechanosensitive ion channel [Bacteroidales bacterium]|nr:mechanosensitive ion channel [Bacteroidales bacterium]MDD4670148.1 mechanosensitive ion channel [Bacteroidales bacterium]